MSIVPGAILQLMHSLTVPPSFEAALQTLGDSFQNLIMIVAKDSSNESDSKIVPIVQNEERNPVARSVAYPNIPTKFLFLPSLGICASRMDGKTGLSLPISDAENLTPTQLELARVLVQHFESDLLPAARKCKSVAASSSDVDRTQIVSFLSQCCRDGEAVLQSLVPKGRGDGFFTIEHLLDLLEGSVEIPNSDVVAGLLRSSKTLEGDMFIPYVVHLAFSKPLAESDTWYQSLRCDHISCRYWDDIASCYQTLGRHEHEIRVREGIVNRRDLFEDDFDVEEIEELLWTSQKRLMEVHSQLGRWEKVFVKARSAIEAYEHGAWRSQEDYQTCLAWASEAARHLQVLGGQASDLLARQQKEIAELSMETRRVRADLESPDRLQVLGHKRWDEAETLLRKTSIGSVWDLLCRDAKSELTAAQFLRLTTGGGSQAGWLDSDVVMHIAHAIEHQFRVTLFPQQVIRELERKLNGSNFDLADMVRVIGNKQHPFEHLGRGLGGFEKLRTEYHRQLYDLIRHHRDASAHKAERGYSTKDFRAFEVAYLESNFMPGLVRALSAASI